MSWTERSFRWQIQQSERLSPSAIAWEIWRRGYYISKLKSNRKEQTKEKNADVEESD